MNLEERYKNETGKSVIIETECGDYFSAYYVDWLEEKIQGLEKKMNPRFWDKNMLDTWHRNIPNVQKAFDELRELAVND